MITKHFSGPQALFVYSNKKGRHVEFLFDFVEWLRTFFQQIVSKNHIIMKYAVSKSRHTLITRVVDISSTLYNQSS